MELSELTTYAEEKFHIQEQHKCADFPGTSVLVNPDTGKWLALLMRQWDFETGEEIQLCDLKCGQQNLPERPEPYLSTPFRMKGNKWVGVKFDDTTDSDVVFRLFDLAVYSDHMQGYTIVLDHAPTESMVIYPDTPLPVQRTVFDPDEPDMPPKIRQMQALYEYNGGRFEEKCWNFYRQGKFMEDYEDNLPWTGTFRCYYPTYHDLNVQQLRGYFTWRTHVRKGDFQPIAISLAYIYIYELLNGIGAQSPEDTFQKLRTFEIGFLNSGFGDSGMRSNLHRWMLAYAVLYRLPPALVQQYTDSTIWVQDTALASLLSSETASDEEVFSALCVFGEKRLVQSPVIKKFGTQGKHLFASSWRRVSKSCFPNGRGFFTACFGPKKVSTWEPFANAIYWESQKYSDTAYVLNPCREYYVQNGTWREKCFDKRNFDLVRYRAFLHETDRILRNHLKTGHYLKRKVGEAWITSFVEAAIQAQQQADEEAARPKITINLSSLEQIRQDASVTRDSLLTGDEMDVGIEASPESSPASLPAGPDAGNEPEPADSGSFAPLDDLHSTILLALLRGESVEATLKARHLMPAVAADTINEALFDEIGDNVLECDGNTITLVGDYRDDLLQLLGGKTNE